METPVKTKPWAPSLIVAALAAVVGFVAVYGTFAPRDNAAAPVAPVLPAAESTGATLPSGPGANPLSKGDMAGFVFKKIPEPLPEIKFVDGTGKERSLAEWKGRTVLLNLWATWCAPCRKEMPALDRLDAELGGPEFEVVALAVDKSGADAAKKFLEQVKAGKLALYIDPDARAGVTLKAVGMPTTLLVDTEGREIGRLVGPAEWDSADAKDLVRAVLSRK